MFHFVMDERNEHSMKKMNLIVLLIWIIPALSCTNQDEYNNFEQMPEDAKQNISERKIRYLALGDSYTIGESVKEDERFPVQLVKRLNDEGILTDSAKIIARTGWTTDELAAGIKNSGISGTYDLVTLLIGVNNQYRGRDTAEYRLQFRNLLQTAIQLANNDITKVIVVSIPDYGVTPFGKPNEKKIGMEIDIFNQINREETESRKAAYVNITSISRLAKEDSSLIATDGLHPSGKMYSLWVDSILPVAKTILSN